MDLFREGMETLQEEGLDSFIAKSGLWAAHPFLNTVTSRHPIGTNIFERDWDLLIILDACRVDMLREVIDSVSWINNVGSIRSVGSSSPEWILKTFTQNYAAEISRTGLLTRNSFTNRFLVDRIHQHNDHHEWGWWHRGKTKWNLVSIDDLAHYETMTPVIEETGLHYEHKINPHILTDRAIAVGRKKDLPRMIVHYTLPHLQFIANALDWDPNNISIDNLMAGPEPIRDLRPEEKGYEPVKRGDVSINSVKDAYRANLRLGLAYVEILLQNIDAEKVVITADHGEGFGEKGIWGHPAGWPFSPVKTVPWAITTAVDERTYQPSFEGNTTSPTEEQVLRNLRDLGYIK